MKHLNRRKEQLGTTASHEQPRETTRVFYLCSLQLFGILFIVGMKALKSKI
jgi:hypothetical protein